MQANPWNSHLPIGEHLGTIGMLSLKPYTSLILSGFFCDVLTDNQKRHLFSCLLFKKPWYY
uniref:Uncharacterized protein n=1 Tax=Anguilla anguilla TaxID=7936 RepID=A0A0E9XKU8_ANGAN